MRRPDNSAYIRIIDADGRELLALDASDSSQVLFKTEDITINQFGNLDWKLMKYVELDEGFPSVMYKTVYAILSFFTCIHSIKSNF